MKIVSVPLVITVDGGIIEFVGPECANGYSAVFTLNNAPRELRQFMIERICNANNYTTRANTIASAQGCQGLVYPQTLAGK